MKTKPFLIGTAVLSVAITGQVLAQNRIKASQIKNAYVRYAAPSSVKTFPHPIVNISRDGLLTDAQTADVMQRLVYPTINRSRTPIGAIMITAYPKAEHRLGFGVYWHDGTWDDRLIYLDRNGKVPPNTVSSRPDIQEGGD